MLFGVEEKKTKCPTIPHEWIARGIGKKRIVLNKKHSLKTELRRFGIAKHTLFPELYEQTAYIMGRIKEKYKREKGKST